MFGNPGYKIDAQHWQGPPKKPIHQVDESGRHDMLFFLFYGICAAFLEGTLFRGFHRNNHIVCGSQEGVQASFQWPDTQRSPAKAKTRWLDTKLKRTGGSYLHADATQPATGHLDLAVLSLPFPLVPISSRDLNLTSFARVSCIFDSFAVSVAVLPSGFRDFSPPPIPRQFPAHPFISQFLFVFHNFHNLFSFPSSVPLV